MEGLYGCRHSGRSLLLALVVVTGLGVSGYGGQSSRQGGAIVQRQGSTASMATAVAVTSEPRFPAPVQGARTTEQEAMASAGGSVQRCLARVALTVPTIT